MLVEDTTAFIEQLEVRGRDRRAEKHRRRRAWTEIDALRAEWEAGVAAEALRRMEEELAALAAAAGAGGPARRLLAARRRRALRRQMATIRGRRDSKRGEVLATRERLRRLEQLGARQAPPAGARVYRLHSARHHLECSERRFTRLASSQTDLPVLVAKQDGRSWWWYRDRFWWDDDGLDALDVRVFVRDAELTAEQRAEALVAARAAVLGEEHPTTAPSEISQVVRFAVWCRDRGRCVDCGTAENLGFDEILPRSRGGSRSAANVELRCEGCHVRRLHNEERARVSRAQVGAVSSVA